MYLPLAKSVLIPLGLHQHQTQEFIKKISNQEKMVCVLKQLKMKQNNKKVDFLACY